MKLPDYVDKIRGLIEAAFNKQFARLGISKNKQLDIDKLPLELRAKRLRLDEMIENHIGKTGDYQTARETLLDELTFTLFNRLAAVKVMEAALLFPPVLTKLPEHGDRSFGHKAWLEINPHMRDEELEGIREYLKHAFNELGESLPLYSKTYPYALLPDAISLNDIIDTFNTVEKDSQVGADIWQSDDILGWLYESYNNAKKIAYKDSGEKVEYHKVSLQSQVYTPRWVVKFLVDNSLGKLYLEMYPDSEIRNQYKIANAPNTQVCKPKPLHEIKAIDLASGSGNFLLYAFDLFYAFYVDQIENYGADYNKDDIPRLIIGHNLHGIDLDDRAVQIAQLGLFIKAKKKSRGIGELSFKVVSSDFYLPIYETVEHIFTEGDALGVSQKKLIAEIWTDIQDAYKFGSLIRISEKVRLKLHQLLEKRDSNEALYLRDSELGNEHKLMQMEIVAESEIVDEEKFAATFFANLKTAVEQYAQAEGNTFLTSKTRDAITYIELLTTEYDVATVNPPYTDSADYGPELKEFVEANYKKPYKFHTNLYAAFIKRCYEMISSNGYIAMVHPPTFMYIKTFEDVRKFMINKTHINLLVEWGYLGMFNPSARVDSVLYILEKDNDRGKEAAFIKLNHLNETKRYHALFEAYEKLLAGGSHELLYSTPQDKLKSIKSWPFIYWISDEFRQKFRGPLLETMADVCKGMDTSFNLRYVKFWWEVIPDELSGFWKVYAKGGPFKKWYGNLWTVINWDNNGEEVKKYPGSTIRNEEYYFSEGITYSTSGTKGASFRLLPEDSIFDAGGNGVFISDDNLNLMYLLAFMNSQLCFYIRDCLNPTVNTTVGDLNRLPIKICNVSNNLSYLTQVNINIKKLLCMYSVVELSFQNSPIMLSTETKNITSVVRNFFNYENHLLTQVLINEAIINENIFDIYDLTEHDKAMVIASEGESIGSLPVVPEARNAYLAETEATKEFPLDNIRDYIESLPTREFSAEEQEKVESGFPTLYQNNNDLEEFCIRHQVNPINVWYWFKQSNVIPQQRVRTLATEFLADMVREILMEDQDGIIPLVPNAEGKILLERIEAKFMEKGFSMAQYSSFDALLGRPIQEYLNRHFFAALSDHLNLFPNLPKTPFIWHLSSGPDQGFDCYIIIYKWSRDKLMRLRSVYIENRERALINRQSDLNGNLSAEAQNERDRIFKQLKEIEDFKTKIDELLAEGYNPILDDGVGKNIAPLQKKKMIPYEVLNDGQLKKYLNADW